MEVLRPQLININGRQYRRNVIKEEQYEEEEDFSYMGPPGKFILVYLAFYADL